MPEPTTLPPAIRLSNRALASGPGLHGLTQAVLMDAPCLIVRLFPHDPTEPETSDRLWFEYVPDDAVNDGEVLCIGPAAPGIDLWRASLESTHQARQASQNGRWSQSWGTTGTADEVNVAVLALLRDKGTQRAVAGDVLGERR